MTSELDALEKELADLDDGGKDGEPRRKLGTAPIVVAVLAVCALGGLIYYAYDQGIREGTEVAAPLLSPEGPAKVKPEDPGGLAVPHRDKTVYDVVQGGASDTSEEKVETLLPPPEEPMTPPAASSGAPATAPVVSATNQLNRTEKPTVPAISPPPLPSEGLAAPEAPATLSESSQAQIEAAQESASETAAAASEAAADPVTESAAITPPPAPVTEPAKPETQVDATAQPAQPTAVAAAAAGALSDNWRVQVGAVRSQDAAEKEWARLVGRHNDLLGDLKLQVQEVDVKGKGTFFRIRGGPMADRAAADGLCDKLKAQKIPCIPVRPGA